MMRYSLVVTCLLSLGLNACSTYSPPQQQQSLSHHAEEASKKPTPNLASRIPSHINTHEKVIVVDPNVHVWGAYGANGDLIRSGMATAGADYCPDLGRRCHTKSGSFRISSLGSPSCKSSIYPLPRGGAPMPYCMFFNGNQGLHGSYQVADANLSHGCVRLHVSDAEWIRYNFANIGTKVVVKPY